ncbi:hypothetical protein [Shewanella aestuarii]|uniref:Uncharacterized protein n=1 Tax=Shewanella aestuarii TaxID=1028752 RepID=A0A6G9QPA5_9GAMM|nr:hypothetical protein [Shewanella aestuarii]QIR16430.1 hypothetical protein HBH39_18330 [Shewanella aestuarii]
MNFEIDSSINTEPNLAKNILALKLHSLGMNPKCINEHLFGTLKFIRKVRYTDESLSFSRGSNVSWTHSKEGFKYSNILFKMYTAVSGDLNLRREPNVHDIASTWMMAITLYPELITQKICDISRFSYLIRRVIDHTIVIDKCECADCNNGFIRDFNVIRNECWHCEMKKEFESENDFDLRVKDNELSLSEEELSSESYSDKLIESEVDCNQVIQDEIKSTNSNPYFRLVFDANESIAKQHLPRSISHQNDKMAM